MNGWEQDKRWSDKFLPEIKSILGGILIGEPPVEEDQKHNTDLMVLTMQPLRIGCRVRRPQFLHYKNDFTIRAGLRSGAETELQKIIKGWGDYFFYGFSNESENALSFWIVGNLNYFRIWHRRELAKLDRGKWPGTRRDNPDGSSYFHFYPWIEIPGFVIASSDQTALQSLRIVA